MDRRSRVMTPLAIAFLVSLSPACVQIQRTPSHPETFSGIDEMCRQNAEDYRERGRAYARCMQEHGYPHQGADDY